MGSILLVHLKTFGRKRIWLMLPLAVKEKRYTLIKCCCRHVVTTLGTSLRYVNPHLSILIYLLWFFELMTELKRQKSIVKYLYIIEWHNFFITGKSVQTSSNYFQKRLLWRFISHSWFYVPWRGECRTKPIVIIFNYCWNASSARSFCRIDCSQRRGEMILLFMTLHPRRNFRLSVSNISFIDAGAEETSGTCRI